MLKLIRNHINGPVCKKGFAAKSNMDAHARIHAKEKPCECSICKKAFTQKRHLKRHVKTH